MREKRKKNLPQSHKRSSSKSIKPDLWKREGFIPNWKSVKQLHRESYEKRLGRPEGMGTGRSLGSNARLKKLLHF